MSVLEKARRLFQEAGLAFPEIPEELAAGLKEQGKWLFSTRDLEMSPYNLDHYVQEGDQAPAAYVVLAHSGHGVNSYAIQYYLVSGPLRLFLHLSWGGVYMDAEAAASKVRECFSQANEIVAATMASRKFALGERLTIVGSDFYGSYWSVPGQSLQEERENQAIRDEGGKCLDDQMVDMLGERIKTAKSEKGEDLSAKELHRIFEDVFTLYNIAKGSEKSRTPNGQFNDFLEVRRPYIEPGVNNVSVKAD